VDQPVDPPVKEYGGRASVCSPHKVCGAGRASPHFMGAGPKQTGSARVATPTRKHNKPLLE